MAFIGQKNYVHINLAARSIIVGDNNVVKIANFELAEEMEGGEFNPQHGKNGR